MLSFQKNKWHKRFKKIFYYLVIVNLLYIIAYIFISPFRHHNLMLSYDEKINQNEHADVKIATFINHHPELYSDKILISRQGSFSYYGKKGYLSIENPKMIKFYESETIDEAKSILKNLGITHFISPSYPIPPLYNSFLPKILSDLNFSKLEKRINGYSFFSLNNKSYDKKITRYMHSNKWVSSENLQTEKSFLHTNISDQNEIISYDNSKNSNSIWLTEGASRVSYLFEYTTDDQIRFSNHDKARLFAIDGEVLIDGQVGLNAIIFDAQGKITRTESIWKGLGKNRLVKIGGQFELGAKENFKLSFFIHPKSIMKLVKLNLSSINLHSNENPTVKTINHAYKHNSFTLKGSNSKLIFKVSQNIKIIPKIELKGLAGYGALDITFISDCSKINRVTNNYKNSSIYNFLQNNFIRLITLDTIQVYYYVSSFVDSSIPKDKLINPTYDKPLFLSNGERVGCDKYLQLTNSNERENSYIKFSDIHIDGKKI